MRRGQEFFQGNDNLQRKTTVFWSNQTRQKKNPEHEILRISKLIQQEEKAEKNPYFFFFSRKQTFGLKRDKREEKLKL